MEAKPRRLFHYEAPDGKIPYRTWYDRIDDIRLKRAVGEGVLELRFQVFGARVYFAEIGEVLLLLLCAGDKSSQPKDIAKAKEYWREFRSRAREV